MPDELDVSLCVHFGYESLQRDQVPVAANGKPPGCIHAGIFD
jgi:hypothetical protein